MGGSSTKVFAGDVGGTKTRLGIFAVEAGVPRLVDERRFDSDPGSSLSEIVARFPAARESGCAAACFGIPGPVMGRRVRTTNLPWVVDADRLVRETGIDDVILINDVEATAWGVGSVREEGLSVLSPGRPGARGNAAVIAAGTGLGEAGIFDDGEVVRPFACEGSHASFSPTDELGDRLLGFFRARYDTVSWDRVVSGPGLVDLFRFLLADAGLAAPDWFTEAGRAGDPAPAVTAAGLSGACDVSRRTLEVFARLYGEEAGNLGLKLMATGGVWVGGGVAPKILPALQSGAFMEGFLAKGRMRPLMQSMPVHVVLDDRTALLGAAHRAALEL